MVGRGLRASQILTLLSPEADRKISAFAGFLNSTTAFGHPWAAAEALHACCGVTLLQNCKAAYTINPDGMLSKPAKLPSESFPINSILINADNCKTYPTKLTPQCTAEKPGCAWL